jgi:hypothetical protein
MGASFQRVAGRHPAGFSSITMLAPAVLGAALFASARCGHGCFMRHFYLRSPGRAFGR